MPSAITPSTVSTPSNLFSTLGVPDFESVLKSLSAATGQASSSQAKSAGAGAPGDVTKALADIGTEGVNTAISEIQKQSELSQMISLFGTEKNVQSSYLQLAKNVSGPVT